jgi:hypothetical protein
MFMFKFPRMGGLSMLKFAVFEGNVSSVSTLFFCQKKSTEKLSKFFHCQRVTVSAALMSTHSKDQTNESYVLRVN